MYGKANYETQSQVSFIFPLLLGHFLPKGTDSFTTASSWSLFSSVLQLTLQWPSLPSPMAQAEVGHIWAGLS